MMRIGRRDSRGCSKDCPGRHGLQPFLTHHSSVECDECRVKQSTGTVMRGCRKCNYDLCEACFGHGPAADVLQALLPDEVKMALLFQGLKMEAEQTTSIRHAGGLSIGDKVRVRPGIQTPRFEWGGVKPGMVGTVMGFKDQEKCVVRFTVHPSWTGLCSELEVVSSDARPGSAYSSSSGGGRNRPSSSCNISVGDQVRVRRSVSEPRYKWGPVNHQMVGTVLEVDDDGDCLVDFPNCLLPWHAYGPEMEVVSSGPGRSQHRRSSRLDARQLRLQEGPVLLLYHQTSEENAAKILRTGRMLRGENGLAGGGIYFAETARETHGKAQQKGVILQAQVQLGNVKQVQDQLQGATYKGLQEEGFDSVCIMGRRTGLEYIVYNFDQVTHIERSSER